MVDAFLHLFRLAANACGTSTGGLPSLYDGLPCTNNAPGIQSVQDVAIVIGNIARVLIAISGSLAIIVLLVAAIYYITAMGEPARIKKAKEIIIQTVIGLVIIILAYALITFIAGEF